MRRTKEKEKKKARKKTHNRKEKLILFASFISFTFESM